MSESEKILVTGGAGYIGSHTCKALSEAGYIPVTYDNLVYGHEYAVKYGPLEVGCIGDRRRVDEVIRKYNPKAIMHFAAYAYVGESVEDPRKYYRNNVAGSLSLLEAAIDYDIDQFIFSSSCAVYGEPVDAFISEDHPKNPINPYGRSKLMIEQILQDFGRAYGLKSISLRYFNAAGADPDGETGEDHNPETHLIPLVLDVANQIRRNITIYGTDYDTTDGTCIRDYIHVTDLAKAHVLALQALEKGVATNAYNLGNGNGFSVREVIDAVSRVTGQPIQVIEGMRRPGDPPRLVGYARRIYSELSWQPEFDDLDDIIETAWKWHQRTKGRR